MPYTRIDTAAFLGLNAVRVHVEADVGPAEKPSFVLVGLPDTAVKESKERVLAAIKNCGFSLDFQKCTINLAPATVKKMGSLYDFPIALALLNLLKAFPDKYLDSYLYIGELALDGSVRPIHGTLSAALLAKEMGKKGILVPHENAEEAALVSDIQVFPIDHLRQAIAFFKNPHSLNAFSHSNLSPLVDRVPAVDFASIRGQEHVKRALEIAAAGGHNILLSGPPGSGKTLAARALAGILPPLELNESLEVTKIHSIAGLLQEETTLIRERPFRSPHHTISHVGMIGGGTHPRPGEVSLAHHGVLFLDELPEFSRATLESLRQPLEDRVVTVTRAQGSVLFPTDFICIAAMNPCPCGFLGHPKKPCRDSSLTVERYRNKISGPFLDRIDMHIAVSPVELKDISSLDDSENSKTILERILKARMIQKLRFQKTNGRMQAQEISRWAPLSHAANCLLHEAVDRFGMSMRAVHRILKVARTIADLASCQNISEEHLAEALSYRRE